VAPTQRATAALDALIPSLASAGERYAALPLPKPPWRGFLQAALPVDSWAALRRLDRGLAQEGGQRGSRRISGGDRAGNRTSRP
jgi:hypothetical protein